MRIRNEHIYAFREGKLDEIPAEMLPELEKMHEKKPELKEEKKESKKAKAE